MTTARELAGGYYRRGQRLGDVTYVIPFRRETGWSRLEDKLVALTIDVAVKAAQYPPNMIGNALWDAAASPFAGPLHRAYGAAKAGMRTAITAASKAHKGGLERTL